jgi:hypothetical protein
MDPFDPPNPIPAWLTPQGGPLFHSDEDLRIVLTVKEFASLATLLGSHGVTFGEWSNVMLTLRDGSPWLEVAVASGGHAAQYALWRYTGNVYRVGANGAVEDDPLDLSGKE